MPKNKKKKVMKKINALTLERIEELIRKYNKGSPSAFKQHLIARKSEIANKK